MKQKFLLKTMLLLCALVVGSANVWATDPSVTFTFNSDAGIEALGITKPSSSTGTSLATTAYTLSGVSMTATHGTNETRIWNSSGTLDLRIYKSGGSLKFDAPGTITGITITGSTTNVFTVNVGSYSDGTWTKDNENPTTSVTFTATGTGKISTITVTYAAPTPSISADDVDIAADILAGNISYSISNPDGSTLTAAKKSGDWLTVGAVDAVNKKVAFTATENIGDVRTAVVTLTYGDVTKDVTITQAAAATKYTVTYDGSPSNGTLVIKRGETTVSSGDEVSDGTVLTIEATPSDAHDYALSKWEYKEDGGSWTDGVGTSYTIDGKDVEFRATFVARIYHNITYSVNGATTVVEVEEGDDVSFAAPASGIPTGYYFKGWRTSTLAVTDTDPDDYVTSATSTADITYYAVVAKVISLTPESWTETALASLTSSDIFVFSNGTYAMNNDGGTSSAPSVNSITVSGSNITSAVANNLKWNVTGNATDGYTFYPNGSTTTWLYCNTTASSGSNNNIRVGTGDRKVWKPNGSGYLVTNDTNTDRYLSIYSAQDFRGYVNGDNAFVPKFYKYIAPVPTYGGYCTSIPPVSVTVGTDSYATFASNFPLDFTGSDIKAYIAKGKADYSGVTFTQINKVPANTGVLLYYDGGTSDDIPVFAGAADATTGNVFVRGTGATVASEDGDLHNYILNKVGGVVGFYKANDKTVATNRAYIQIDESKSYSVKEFIALPGFDDDADGIKSLTPALSEGEGEIYNLAGQRLSKMQKGINIVNGKKIAIK